MRLNALKREEEAVKDEEARLNAEKIRHIRALKRLRDEVRVVVAIRFQCNPFCVVTAWTGIGWRVMLYN